MWSAEVREGEEEEEEEEEGGGERREGGRRRGYDICGHVYMKIFWLMNSYFNGHV